MNRELNDLNEEGWQGLDPAARRLLLVLTVLPFAILAIPALALALRLLPGWWGWTMVVPWVAIGLLAVRVGHNRWTCTRWRLEASGFRLRKGRWWQTEVFVPRSRVQHLDIQSGPLERKRGLATLVIHTAGTESHALKQGGFRLETAKQLRDALIPELGRDDSAL